MFTIPKDDKKKLKKRIYNFFWNSKMQPPRQLTQLSRHSMQLNCIKAKLIFIKSHQCFPEKSHAVLIEVNSEFLSKPSLF